MFRLDLSPATRLLVWLSLLIAVQGLDGFWLGAACVMSLFLGPRVVRRAWWLAWRIRWVIVSILVFFSWGAAGEPLWAGAGSPTVDGIHQGLTHLGRLGMVLIVLSALLGSMPMADMLAATHVLLRPFRRVGLEPDRGVIRLMLVLDYVESLPRSRDWRSLLSVSSRSKTELVEVSIHPIRWRDAIVLALWGSFYSGWILIAWKP